MKYKSFTFTVPNTTRDKMNGVKTIDNQAKQIAYNLYTYFKHRKRDRNTKEYQEDADLAAIVSEATGLSLSSAKMIIREGNKLKYRDGESVSDIQYQPAPESYDYSNESSVISDEEANDKPSTSKKRKIDFSNLRSKSTKDVHIQTELDQFQVFANLIAEQLKEMPFDKALKLQLNIQKMINEERIAVKIKNEFEKVAENTNTGTIMDDKECVIAIKIEPEENILPTCGDEQPEHFLLTMPSTLAGSLTPKVNKDDKMTTKIGKEQNKRPIITTSSEKTEEQMIVKRKETEKQTVLTTRDASTQLTAISRKIERGKIILTGREQEGGQMKASIVMEVEQSPSVKEGVGPNPMSEYESDKDIPVIEKYKQEGKGE